MGRILHLQRAGGREEAGNELDGLKSQNESPNHWRVLREGEGDK